MNRRLVVDAIRVIAILGVLSVHVTNRSLAVVNYDILRLPLTFFIEVASRFAVPLFFIVSGYALSIRYEKRLDPAPFYKKRVMKLLIPYCIWSLFYMLYENIMHASPMTFYTVIDKLITGGAAVQMYFIPSIFLLYVLFPVIKKYISFISAKIIIIYTIIELCLLSYDYFIGPIFSFTPLRIAILNLYPFLIGMLTFMHEKGLVSFLQSRIKILFITILIVLLALFIQTQQVYLLYNNVYYIDSQWQPIIFFYTILLWIFLFVYLKDKLYRFEKVIHLLSQLSFFVYFVHLFYENLFWRIIGSYLLNKSEGRIVDTFWFTPFVYLFVVLASYGTAYLVRFIPRVHRYLGIN